MKWWEKTVEYLFVINSVRKNQLNLSPLDGKHELAGDLIAASNAMFFLVEFKANYSAIISEQEKFFRYDLARNALNDRDQHHFIVYGEKSEHNTLELKAQTYFSQTETSIDAIFVSGIDVCSFKNYLQEYIDFKLPTGGGPSGVNPLNFGMVAAVDNTTGKANTISVEEFLITLKLTKKQTKSFTLGM